MIWKKGYRPLWAPLIPFGNHASICFMMWQPLMMKGSEVVYLWGRQQIVSLHHWYNDFRPTLLDISSYERPKVCKFNQSHECADVPIVWFPCVLCFADLHWLCMTSQEACLHRMEQESWGRCAGLISPNVTHWYPMFMCFFVDCDVSEPG